MATDFDAVRRQIADLPESADKHSMLELVAREEALENAYAVHLDDLRRASEKLKRQRVKDRVLAVVIFAPIASFFGFHLLSGLLKGRITNFVLGGGVDYFSITEFPSVVFADDPYLFGIVAFLYGSIAFAFSAAAIGVEYFGRRERDG